MAKSDKRLPPALRHGVYSAITVMPTEDPAAFEKLHKKLAAELMPSGELEHDIVATLARLIWRKQNLATLSMAEVAHQELESIRQPFYVSEQSDRQADEELGREHLGHYYELAEVGTRGNTDGLAKALDILERLEGQIDRCLKRLLFLRGLKSISLPASSENPTKVLPTK
jgi:hypothetical protein